MESRQERKIKCSTVFIIMTVALSLALVLASQPTRAMYMPHRRSHQSEYMPEMGLDGSEEDDMDQTASAPNRHRESNSESPGSDGYEENEPDGPYGETKRDEEGQADLERFFDDHLGASERDGMDKENLPTNIAPSVSNEISSLLPLVEDMRRGEQDRSGTGLVPADDTLLNNNNYQTLSSTTMKTYQKLNTDAVARPNNVEWQTSEYLKTKPSVPVSNVETKYIELPNKRVLITRQITPLKPMDNKERRPARTTDNLIRNKRLPTAPVLVGGDGGNKKPPVTLAPPARQQLVSSTSGGSPSPSQSSDVLATENDDYDQVYVTNKTNQPFKIEALGGYDPEEDFQDASRDIEEPTKFNPFQERQGAGKRGKVGKKETEEVQKDINFNDPESDNLFDAASETDEVTFNQDDPYQNDEDGEQPAQEHQQAHDETQTHGAPTPLRRVQDDGEPDYSSGGGPDLSEADPVGSVDYDSTGNNAVQDRAGRGRGSGDNDELDSNWVNDGVDDMEVPSQQHQDMVLEKAAKAEAEAQKRRDEAEAAAAARAAARGDKPDDNDNEEEGQRMPNADYMKEDTDEIDKKR